MVTLGLCSVQWILFWSQNSHCSMAERSLRVTAPSGALTGNETTQVLGLAGVPDEGGEAIVHNDGRDPLLREGLAQAHILRLVAGLPGSAMHEHQQRRRGRGRVLRQVAGRSFLQARIDQRAVGVRRKKNHSSGQLVTDHRVDNCHTVEVRHLVVHQCHVRALLADGVDGLPTGVSFGHDLDPTLLERSRHAVAKEGMIVGDHDSQSGVLGWHRTPRRWSPQCAPPSREYRDR